MKRSPLNRKSPLKRQSEPLKKTQRGWNSTLRNKSPEQAKRDRKMKPLLDEYREKFPRCQGRLCNEVATDIHEIAGGPLRQKSRKNRACILHLCRACHEEMQPWAKSSQLAVKLYSDPKGYSLEEYNAVVEGFLSEVTQEEVNEAIEAIFNKEP